MRDTRPAFISGVGLLFAVTLLAYAPAIGAGFIWDDPQHVVENPTLRSVGGLAAMWLRPTSIPQYYPVVHTTFWLEYHAWGLWPVGYHVDNIFLHALNAVLVWRLLTRLNIPGSFLAAVVFAVHPVNVESVAWITERKNVLSATFYLLALGAGFPLWGLDESAERSDAEEKSIRSGRLDAPGRSDAGGGFSVGRYFATFVLFFLALLSKSVTCTLPVVFLLLAWRRRGKISFREALVAAPMFLAGLLLGLNTARLERDHVGAVGTAWAFSPAQRILIASRAIWFYIGKLLFPTRLSFVYPPWHIDPGAIGQWMFPLAVVAGFAALWIGRGRFGRGPLTAAIFFALTLFPALGFVNIFPMRYTFVADHYQYLASLGVIVPGCAAFSSAGLFRLRFGAGGFTLAATAAAVAATIALAVITFDRTRVYHDPVSLWTDTLAKNPDSWMARENMGQALEATGDAAGAEHFFVAAVAADPSIPETHWKLGVYYVVNGEPEKAIAPLAEAARLKPDWSDAYRWLGRADEAAGRTNDALEAYSTAIAVRPNSGEAHEDLAKLLLKLGRADDAVREFSVAVNLLPGRVDVLIDLGDATLQAGNAAAATRIFQQALARDPGSVAARDGLAKAKGTMGE
jgi:Flp pilus assembly protein TadD